MMLKTHRFLLSALLLGMAIFCNAQTQKGMKNQAMNAEQNAVLKAIENMTGSFQNKDIDGVMACYEPNAVIVFEPGSPISDVQVLRKMFQEMSMVNPVFTYSGHEVFISGNIATHIAPWKMTGKAPDGTIIEQSGLSVAILRKQADGSWLMILDNPHGQILMQQ